MLGISKRIPVDIMVTDGTINLPSSMLLAVSPVSDSFTHNQKLSFTATITNLMTGSHPEVRINYSILTGNGSSIFLGSDSLNVSTSRTLIKEFQFPNNISEGL
ncbi:MAG: hypothetical protein NTZ02_01060, partial [Candidatus Woesearchaeota archaeon]|nr:hypothetical protein [Candidatus Woesearchaeota archaeon]